MKNSEIIIAIALFLAAMFFVFSFAMDPEKYCDTDVDCSCGTHIETGECFYGNKAYVNEKEQCPDFCTGIAAHLEIRCVDNECKQVSLLK